MEIFLAGGSIIGDHHIQRGALFVEMGTIRVCCTHLDHISENERAIQAGGLIHDGPAPDAIFLSTGDVIGYLDPCG